MPVIPDTQEVEAAGSMFEASPGAVNETLTSKTK
jgi:hypothetical protein